MLYAIVAGFLPFEEHKASETENLCKFYECIIRSEIIFPLKMSKELKDLLSQMLHPVPEHRPTITQIKVHPWLAV